MPAKFHDTFQPESYYHIYNRSINKESLFLSDRNYLFFLSQWKKYLHEYVDVLSYCLLPDHFHFFLKVKDQNCEDLNTLLEQQFKKFFSSYTLAFNKDCYRRGSLFQKRFKRIKVEEEAYFTSMIRYIHNNPIHHHLVSEFEDWKYSSYNSIISDLPTYVHRKEVLDWFGGKSSFIDFHNQNIVYDKYGMFNEF